eukprot:5702219-Amphidinium_carterae.1
MKPTRMVRGAFVPWMPHNGCCFCGCLESLPRTLQLTRLNASFLASCAQTPSSAHVVPQKRAFAAFTDVRAISLVQVHLEPQVVAKACPNHCSALDSNHTHEIFLKFRDLSTAFQNTVLCGVNHILSSSPWHAVRAFQMLYWQCARSQVPLLHA